MHQLHISNEIFPLSIPLRQKIVDRKLVRGHEDATIWLALSLDSNKTIAEDL